MNQSNIYHRFNLSHRDIEDFMSQGGIDVSYARACKTVRAVYAQVQIDRTSATIFRCSCGGLYIAQPR